LTPQAARDLLQVGESAGADEIKRAYRRVALTAHPDCGGSSERFVALQAARDLLIATVPGRDNGLLTGAAIRRAFADCIAGRISETELKRRLAESRRLRDLGRAIGAHRSARSASVTPQLRHNRATARKPR
jgi:hypothetical protein